MQAENTNTSQSQNVLVDPTFCGHCVVIAFAGTSGFMILLVRARPTMLRRACGLQTIHIVGTRCGLSKSREFFTVAECLSDITFSGHCVVLAWAATSGYSNLVGAGTPNLAEAGTSMSVNVVGVH